MSSAPIALILGAGKNIGAHVGRAFVSKGYRVALAARTAKQSTDEKNELNIICDLSKPSSVGETFATVRKTWGEPSVVIYNAAAAHFGDKVTPFAVSVDDFANDLVVNSTSAYAAAQDAIASFEKLDSQSSKTFIYTGNFCNTNPMPAAITLGVGKAAAANMIQAAAQTYSEKGIGFYYADQRTATGKNISRDIDGAAAADFYTALAEGSANAPWLATFVKGEGYKKFDH